MLRTVTIAYRRIYDDPINLVAGEQVQITKRDMWDEHYLWLWGISNTGKEGWIPATILQVEGDSGTIQRDYSALELTVNVGDTLTIHDENSGWYWCENSSGERGWVPVRCFT